MLATILVSSCISVQGTIARKFADGKVSVRVGSQTFTGFPVKTIH